VEATFTIHSNLQGEIKAVTTHEIEAKQHEEEAKKQEEALQKLEANLKKQEEALKKAEEHGKQAGEEAKKHEEELNAQIAAIKKHQEEEAAKKKQEESKPPTRGQLLSKALAQCKKEPKSRRAQCVAKAKKKYGHKAKSGKGKK
jgi:colicin import membrane protein